MEQLFEKHDLSLVATGYVIMRIAMIALWLAQGEAVQAGAVGPMMLGSSAVAGYALLASETLHGRFAIFKPTIASDRT